MDDAAVACFPVTGWLIRLAGTAGLCLLLAGCGAFGESVPLLTDEVACFAGGETGSTEVLRADPEHGTTFGGLTVMWPSGYSGRRSGAEVVVVDAQGIVKAITGRTYHISHAMAKSLGLGPVSAYVAAVDCGYPWDFIDCTANPDNQYCHRD
ncbi:MAG TPA: hypothetical protein VFI15_01855 [Candidatus Limnocylindrales bacterium]|nr:hypothetical protein [Candidatus Limnocylindrales bacterium]